MNNKDRTIITLAVTCAFLMVGFATMSLYAMDMRNKAESLEAILTARQVSSDEFGGMFRDTDGDTISDYDEIHTYLSDPRDDTSPYEYIYCNITGILEDVRIEQQKDIFGEIQFIAKVTFTATGTYNKDNEIFIPSNNNTTEHAFQVHRHDSFSYFINDYDKKPIVTELVYCSQEDRLYLMTINYLQKLGE